MHLLTKLLLDKELTSKSVIYVNTLLPFGANLYALLTGRKLICHIHEVSLTPYLFYRSLVTLNRYSSDLNIFVSEEHYNIAGVRRADSKIVPNSVDTHFLSNGKTHSYTHKVDGEFVILMICGAARYKGIPEFFEMARETGALNFNISFKLVINCSPDEIQSHTPNNRIPPNVTVCSVTDDVTTYYRSASMLVNLSRPDMWVETFGLTILEAMAFGVPVIAPPVGGPIDIVSDNIDGFLIDSRDIKKIVNSIVDLYLNPTKHRNMSNEAKLKAKDYSYDNFKKLLLPIIKP
jgi:glycosyltransferase involved in cell wall biosynthesis